MFEKIIQRICDTQSREIFEARMLYSVTGDYNYIRKIVNMTTPAKMLREKYSMYSKHTFIIWGADFLGSVLLKSFEDIKFEAFIDNAPKVDRIEGVPVYGKDVFLNKFRDSIVVIASVGHYDEILKQLFSYGVCSEHIVNIGEATKQMLNEQYFDVPELYHAKDEVFVDAGFFDGETSANFIKWSNGEYKQIIGFEPDNMNYTRYISGHDDNGKIMLLNACVWNEETVLGFGQTGKSSAAIDRGCSNFVQAKKLDDLETKYPISFIKMDIEGAEKEALLGAAETIKRNKPKLAICIYHKREDIWEIPELILSLNPEYRFVLRHYSLRDAETVLYAI